MSDSGRMVSDLQPAGKRELLARLLRERAMQPTESGEPAIVRVVRDRPLAASFAQQRLWIIDQLEPGGSAYNIPTFVRLQGALDEGALERTLAAIVARHEPLRTVFHVDAGQPVQIVEPAGGWRLEEQDLTTMPEDERSASVHDRCAAWASEPFDLAQGPPFRARLWRLASEEHVLGLVMHHIVADEWSLGVLAQELATGYAAERGGTSAIWPPLAIQYADFAAWQREWLQGDILENQLQYWRRQLSGVPVVEVPTDRPRPTVLTQKGALASRVLPGKVGAALRTLARREGATLFMTLLAGLHALLHRYTGQTDISVGSPIAGRTRPEVERLIGFFVNTLVLRVDLEGDPSFRELLTRVKEVCLGAYAHQEVPFEKLVEELAPARTTNRTPLFQVMLVLQEADTADLRFPGLVATPIEFPRRTAKFDLTFFVGQTGSELLTTVEYNTDLFDAETIERLLRHWEELLGGIVANPDARLSALPLLSAAERRQLVEAWQGPEVVYPAAERLHEVIAAQARRTPAAVAVVGEGGALTYEVLERRANQVAHGLRARGVGPGVLVGIAVERSLELLVGVLGILKAGGAYVPIDPEYPAERVAYMLADAQVPVLLTQTALRGRLAAPGAEVLCPDGDPAWLAGAPTTAPAEVGDAEQLAYVIYTSGSTGRPKGAMNTHRGIGNRLQWMQATYGLMAGDRVLQKTPISFDVSVWELFWPLMTGATLVLARPGGHRDPGYLVETIQRERITVVHFVPSMLQVFLAEPGVEGCGTVRQVLCSGEALPYELAQRCLGRLPGARLDNLYGPTEAAVDVTWWRCEREDPRRLVPIGRPVANTQIYIVDGQGEPVPVGVAGELCIGGVQVGRGYWRRPELTAERFVPDRFSGVPGARLYRTGDRARYLADGNIEYLGRLDFQVKIRGLRIELGEIEAVLGQQAGVREAVVVAREDVPGDPRLVAYLVPQEGAELAIDALRTALRTALPEYMVPGAYVVLAALPLTGSGKVDRRALPAPGPQGAVPGRDYTAPRTETERAIAAIWGELLGVAAVGIHDNFFDLGGHSLLAIRAMHETRKRLQRRLAVRELFNQNLAQVAARVDETTGGAANAPGAAPAPVIVGRESGGEAGESRILTAFYFGEAAQQLFAVRHASRLRGGHPRGAICCYPLGQEYIRSHRAFEQLCNRLAQRGFDALRFDYSGTGDSAGDGDAGNVPRWTDDVEMALEYGRSAGMGPLSLVGLRLGASLAALAGSRRDDVESLVLWHPVADGCAYLEEARAAHRALVEDRELEEALGAEGGRDELLGFPLPQAMRRTIEAVQLLELRRRPARRVLLVELEGKSQLHRSLAAHLTGLGAEVDHAILSDPLIWRDLENNDQPLVPRRTLEHIAAWLDGNRL